VFHQPVHNNRYFHHGKKYNEIDWNDFRAVVEAFTTKIEGWYLAPGHALCPTWDHAFALMSIDCLLIDALSQYYYGALTSEQRVFKRFTRRHFPDFRKLLPEPILHPAPRRPRRKNPAQPRPRKVPKELKRYADVLYVVFRCGILHEAHVMLCGGLAGLDELCDVDTDICTLYRNGSPCPTVRMDPRRIFDAVEAVFRQYVTDLVNPAPIYDVRRKHFKKKFRTSFGIDLRASVL
jgi:hypothetical protein